MAIQKRGGHVSFRRPGIEPQLGKLLSRLALGVPSITQGTQFPQGPQFGDMHYYTGSTDADYTKNNWYAYTPESTWDSMNATNTEGKNVTGDIPSGVTIADYLSKYGDTMEGEITFSDDQTLPAGKLVGDIPSGVRIADYLPIAGGQLLGSLIMSRTNITRLNYLTGYDDDIKIDIGTDGTMALSADTLISLTAATLQLTGALALTGNLDITGDLTVTGDTNLTGAFDLTGSAVLSGDLQVNGGDIGLSGDTDLIQIAANLVTVNGAGTLSGNLQVNGGDIGISTDTDLLQLAANLLTINGDIKASGYKTGTETGQTTTQTVVSDVRDNAGQMQKKTQLLTFTNGLLTAQGAESAWTNTTDI